MFCQSCFHRQLVAWRGHYRAVFRYSRLNVLLFKKRKGKGWSHVYRGEVADDGDGFFYFYFLIFIFFTKCQNIQTSGTAGLMLPVIVTITEELLMDEWIVAIEDIYPHLGFNLLCFSLSANWKKYKQTNKKKSVVIHFKSSIGLRSHMTA